MSQASSAPRYCIVVHAGAGSHATSTEQRCLDAVTAALKAAKRALLEEHRHRSHASRASATSASLKACVAAVASMEDDPTCNAGTGSNLTEDGRVECDAAVMDGRNQTYGACGAVPGVRNPVHLAERLLEHQLGRPRPYGRVHPMLLVGEGARQWACNEGLVANAPAAEDALVTERTRATWRRLMRNLREEEAKEASADRKRRRDDDLRGVAASRDESTLHDTVGAVVYDGHDMASAVSSGGVWLKHSGRVGEAAMFGAGCWASRSDGDSRSERGHASAAASVSGVGEQVMARLLAREACAALTHADDATRCCGEVLEALLTKGGGPSEGVRPIDGPSAGIAAIRCTLSSNGEEPDDESGDGPALVAHRVEWAAAHTTPSFAIGILTRGEQPEVFISRRGVGDRVGVRFGGVSI